MAHCALQAHVSLARKGKPHTYWCSARSACDPKKRKTRPARAARSPGAGQILQRCVRGARVIEDEHQTGVNPEFLAADFQARQLPFCYLVLRAATAKQIPPQVRAQILKTARNCLHVEEFAALAIASARSQWTSLRVCITSHLSNCIVRSLYQHFPNFSDLRRPGRDDLHTWQAGLQTTLITTQRAALIAPARKAGEGAQEK